MSRYLKRIYEWKIITRCSRPKCFCFEDLKPKNTLTFKEYENYHFCMKDRRTDDFISQRYSKNLNGKE